MESLDGENLKFEEWLKYIEQFHIVQKKYKLKYTYVGKVILSEISSLNDLYTTEVLRKQQLLNENETLLNFIKEDSCLIDDILEYLKNYNKDDDKFFESLVDDGKGVFFKEELVHREIVSYLKRVSKHQFAAPSVNTRNKDLFLSNACGHTKDVPKKTFHDILSVLVYELGLTRKIENKTGILQIDDSIPQEYINMLFCGDIVKTVRGNTSNIQLK